jgi:hypothetical protein
MQINGDYSFYSAGFHDVSNYKLFEKRETFVWLKICSDGDNNEGL